MNLTLNKTNYMSPEKVEPLKQKYIQLLRSTEVEGIDDLIDYLQGTDFFVAPASSKFHGNYKFGLLLHSLNVLSNLVKINQSFNLAIPDNRMILAALLHDICKAGCYKQYEFRRNIDRTWFTCIGYKYETDLPLGHGEKSVMIAQQFIKLDFETLAMIRWHMGAYEDCNKLELASACNKYKSVVALQIADTQASNFMEDIVELGPTEDDLR